jgi:hypothetical protein
VPTAAWARRVRDGARLVGRLEAEALEHVGDDAVPLALLALRRRDALEVVAQRAARLHQLLAGPGRQRHRLGRRHALAGAEIRIEIGEHRVGLARAELRAAQHHVMDVPLPADRPVAHRQDHGECVALRAGGGDEVAPVTRRQRVGGLRQRGCRREPERDGETRNSKAAHGHTLRVRRSATE